MQISDVFGADKAFNNLTISALLSKAPYQQGLVSRLGLFTEKGQNTTTAAIEILNGRLGLIGRTIPTGPYQTAQHEKRNLYSAMIPYFKVEDRVELADLLNRRALGSSSTATSVDQYVNERINSIAASHLVNIEYQYVNALQGLVKDEGGNTVLNYNTLLGTSQATQVIDWDDADTNVALGLMQARGKMEEKLGNTDYSRPIVIAGQGAFEKLRSHAKVAANYAESTFATQFFITGNPFDSFDYAGTPIIRYPNRSVSGQAFMPTAEALMIPLGVADMMVAAIAPATWDPTGNPNKINALTKLNDDESAVRIFTQSAVLAINTRPDACVKITRV